MSSHRFIADIVDQLEEGQSVVIAGSDVENLRDEIEVALFTRGALNRVGYLEVEVVLDHIKRDGYVVTLTKDSDPHPLKGTRLVTLPFTSAGELDV